MTDELLGVLAAAADVNCCTVRERVRELTAMLVRKEPASEELIGAGEIRP